VSDIEIRELRPEEYDEGGRVTAEAYRVYARGSDWDAYLVHIAGVAERADRTTVLGAFDDGRIVATVTLELDRRVEEGQDHQEAQRLPSHEAHIRMLGVHPAAQGRGIGKALMDETIRLARERGKTLMTLHTTERMTAAQGMYEAMGFRRLPDWRVSEDFVLLTYALSLA
jgi:ribosomal protein S18 acetylase RimI-like enzyme